MADSYKKGVLLNFPVSVDLKCNHEMVNFYYLKTISEGNRNKYIGKKCQSLSDAYEGNCNGNDGIMGYDAIKR